MDGLLSFFASHHAIRAEKVLAGAGFDVQLVAGPKHLSPNCGAALRFRMSDRDPALAALEEARVRVDEVHRYEPDTDRFPGTHRVGRKRRFGRSARRG